MDRKKYRKPAATVKDIAEWRRAGGPVRNFSVMISRHVSQSLSKAVTERCKITPVGPREMRAPQYVRRRMGLAFRVRYAGAQYASPSGGHICRTVSLEVKVGRPGRNQHAKAGTNIVVARDPSRLRRLCTRTSFFGDQDRAAACPSRRARKAGKARPRLHVDRWLLVSREWPLRLAWRLLVPAAI